MELKTFVSEIVKDWSEYPKSKKVKKIEGLNGYLSYETGLSGENYTIKKLRKLHPKYEFVLTDGSKSPADIIGLNKNTKYFLNRAALASFLFIKNFIIPSIA